MGRFRVASPFLFDRSKPNPLDARVGPVVLLASAVPAVAVVPEAIVVQGLAVAVVAVQAAASAAVLAVPQALLTEHCT